MTDLPTQSTHRQIQETTMNTKTINFRHIIAGATFTILLGGFAAAGYAADGTVAQETVKYTDLNVASTQGTVALYSRIRWAAQDVCRSLDKRDPGSQKLFSDCVNKAVSDAVHNANQPALSAYYSAKNGTSKPIILASGQTR
jgi:UrcA family protein